MKISKKTQLSFTIFTISGLIFMIQLSETTGLNMLSVFEKLDEKDLELGKSIVEQCKLSPEKYTQMKKSLFDAEKELLNDNPTNAAKYFNLIRPDLEECEFELSGKPHPIQTIVGQIALGVSLVSGSTSLGMVIYENINKKHK